MIMESYRAKTEKIFVIQIEKTLFFRFCGAAKAAKSVYLSCQNIRNYTVLQTRSLKLQN